MKERKVRNNKGFSLVELIIVIAIMAILIGVMAPQLIRYLDKANVSSDAQLADTVRTAVTVAMMDPDVVNAAAPGIPAANAVTRLSGADVKDEFAKSVKETLGVTGGALTTIENKLKSKGAKEIWFSIVDGNSVVVYVTEAGADATTATTTKMLIKVPQQ